MINARDSAMLNVLHSLVLFKKRPDEKVIGAGRQSREALAAKQAFVHVFERCGVVEVLPVLRTASFDQALSYSVPKGMEPRVGQMVRVPLGPRELYGYVVSRVRFAGPQELPEAKLRPIAGLVDAPPAFDEALFQVAQWMAERYCCSLREALSALVHAVALPRDVERFTPLEPRPSDVRLPSVPPRLLALIWEDFQEGFTLQGLLRHPEARRAGERRVLLKALTALVRAGCVKRTRSLAAPSMEEAKEKFLEATGLELRGKRVTQLIARVQEEGTYRRSDALLEGFSAALIARALREGALRESTRRARRRRSCVQGESSRFQATSEQAEAIAAILARVRAGGFAEVLLEGITGSGKTFVYIEAIREVVAQGGRAIVLVPEIALTPQTARRFEGAFERVAVLHSGLSERERFDGRQAAARGEIDVVVGARSAVFAPLPGLRLIVIDEAHEATYKQESTPRYNTVDVARERMRLAGGTLLLGSATPALENYAAAQAGQVEHLRLRSRATAQTLPPVHVVDMSEELAGGNRRIFSTRLVEAMSRRLERKEKVVLFLNRRGSAGVVLCRVCGAVPECTRCSLSLTVHRAEGLLRCHMCDAQKAIPSTCSACASSAIRELGAGTQKVAEAVREFFPHARVVRMDADTTTRIGDHARLLDEFAESADVLVGTQMVAKGLDFPTVTLVGVVMADIGLHVPDFRSAERTFAVLTQVAGRSGRARPGEAIVQTYSPTHPAIVFAARHDYEGFARYELEQRRALRYPPFGKLVYLGVLGSKLEDVTAHAQEYALRLASVEGAEVLGPAPFPVARVQETWRYRIAVKIADTTALRAFIREHIQPSAARRHSTRLLVNVDP